MLRPTVVLTCLILAGSSCSKAKQNECSEGTDPRTGECVSLGGAEAARIATLTAQLDAQTRQIQEMIRRDREKQDIIERQRAILNDPNATQTQKDKAVQALTDLGINLGVKAGEKVGNAALRWLDGVLGLEPAQTQPSTATGAQ